MPRNARLTMVLGRMPAEPPSGNPELREELERLLDLPHGEGGWCFQVPFARAELLYVGMNLLVQSNSPAATRKPASS